MMNAWQVRFSVLALMVALAAGCSGDAKPKQTIDLEIKRLGIMYMKFVGRHQGKPPASRTELEGFIKALPKPEQDAMGVANPAEIFQSSRDGEEIVVKYGVALPPPGPKLIVVAHEKAGVNGKQMVVYSNGGVDEIPAEKLQELLSESK